MAGVWRHFISIMDFCLVSLFFLLNSSLILCKCGHFYSKFHPRCWIKKRLASVFTMSIYYCFIPLKINVDEIWNSFIIIIIIAYDEYKHILFLWHFTIFERLLSSTCESEKMRFSWNWIQMIIKSNINEKLKNRICVVKVYNRKSIERNNIFSTLNSLFVTVGNKKKNKADYYS